MCEVSTGSRTTLFMSQRLISLERQQQSDRSNSIFSPVDTSCYLCYHGAKTCPLRHFLFCLLSMEAKMCCVLIKGDSLSLTVKKKKKSIFPQLVCILSSVEHGTIDRSNYRRPSDSILYNDNTFTVSNPAYRLNYENIWC